MQDPSAVAVHLAPLVRRLRGDPQRPLLCRLRVEGAALLLDVGRPAACLTVEEPPPEPAPAGSATDDLQPAEPELEVEGALVAVSALLSGERSLRSLMQAGAIAPSDLSAARRLAALCAAAVPAPAPTEPPAPVPPSAWAGRSVGGGVTVVRAAQMATYAGATGDDSVAYLGPDAVAPPMLHAALFRDELFALMRDPVVQPDFSRLLHAGHDVHLLRPLRPGEVVVRRARVSHVAQKSGGLLVSGALQGFVAGALVLRARTTFFVPGQQVRDAGWSEGPAPALLPDAPAGAPDWTWAWTIPDGQAHAYAHASGDDNPLHLDPAVAQAAGHPDVLVHGLCVLAQAAAGLTRRVLHGDPRSLRRIGARFTAPVHEGARLVGHAWATPRGASFTVRDDRGRAVLSRGVLHWRSEQEGPDAL